MYGKHFPCLYPASLETIRVYIRHSADLCAVFLYQLAASPLRLQHLRRLHILGYPTPLLTPDVMLPRLEELRVSVQEGPVDTDFLTWLEHQPCDRLWLQVNLQHSTVQPSTEAVSWLLDSKAYAIVLRPMHLLGQGVQQVWQGLPPSLHRELDFCSCDVCSDQVAAAVLQTLPGWDRLTFESSVAIELSWADLIGRVGTTLFIGYPEQQLSIVGCTGLPPDHLTMPWQLLIEGGVSVRGQNLPVFQQRMPREQASWPTLKLLNKAAVAAGW